MSLFDKSALDDLIEVYQQGIDALLLSYGKNVIIHFKNSITNVPTTMDDSIRNDSIKKPIYKDIPEPTIVENTRTITALIRNNPSDFQRFNLKIDNPQNIVRLKTKVIDLPDLQRCDFITVNDDEDGDISRRYKLLRLPIPIGLGQNKYGITYFEAF